MRTVAAALTAGITRIAAADYNTFDRRAWLGVVPFRMVRTRFRWLPPLPTAHTFPELNVRTYVRAAGRPGVWFFSLDAASRLAVAGARAGFGLPYFHPRMQCERDAEGVRYASERVDARAPAANFRAMWSTSGPVAPATPGTLEHFLVERYCLFARQRGRLVCGDIAHAPWQLANSNVQLDACDMTRLLGCELVGKPVSALRAAPVTVAAFSPVAWP